MNYDNNSLERANRIKEISEQRRVEHLIHFTRIQNLENILHEGLLSRSMLEKRPQNARPAFNDDLRLDREKDAICLTVGYPNYYCLGKFKKRHNNKIDDWVIILLKPSILWELRCAFCKKNAASSSVTRIPLESRETPEAFEKLFLGTNANHHDGLTTDVQSEVLVFEPITPDYFLFVHFYTQEVYSKWYSVHFNLFRSFQKHFFSVDPRYFDERKRRLDSRFEKADW